MSAPIPTNAKELTSAPANPLPTSPKPPPKAGGVPNNRAKPRKKRSGPTSMGQGENTGRWTAEEHRLFLQGLEQHGKGWKKIASLIKSRTVVQIRTHAQKYFQKLAKARQNGEEGDITMDSARGGMMISSSCVASVSSMVVRRRRPVTGTKRKALGTLVASAQRQGKKLAAAQEASGVTHPVAPLPAVSPVLAHFVVPEGATSTTLAEIPPPESVSGPSLEDSLFRFLTPCPPADAVVTSVARQAGAGSIALPTNEKQEEMNPGEASPTGVDELTIYPSWTDTKEAPSWYAKGADVDELLDVADSLDWLADPGDANETYEAPPMEAEQEHNLDEIKSDRNSESVGSLPRVDSSIDGLDPSLPSLFPSESTAHLLGGTSDNNLKETESNASMMEAHLQVFDTPMEEQAFVSTILASADEELDSFSP